MRERPCPNCGAIVGCDGCEIVAENDGMMQRLDSLKAEVEQHRDQQRILEAETENLKKKYEAETEQLKEKYKLSEAVATHLREKISDFYQDFFLSLVRAIDLKDHDTLRHTVRVTEYALAIGRLLALDKRNMKILEQAASIHDLGKMNVSEKILRKPGPLTDEEMAEMKKHPDTAYEILRPIVREIAVIVHCHHERYDGTGYPRRLKGDEVPFLAYVIGLADAIDAMLKSRGYRNPMTAAEVITEIKYQSGKQFHPDIVQVVIDNIEAIFG